jgi:hypothetical protein
LGHKGEIGWRTGGEKEKREEGRWPAKLLGRRGEKREVSWAGKGERERVGRGFGFFLFFQTPFQTFKFKLFSKFKHFKPFSKFSKQFKNF